MDVDTTRDTPLFVSPKALAQLPSPWGAECIHLVQHFFQTVIALIKDGNDAQAEYLLSALREPNETHLGLSKGRSRGRALGDESAHKVWSALRQSDATRSGLLTDLEDTAMLIPGIGIDIVSDITTNLIRRPLISYTQEVSSIYGIPLTKDVASGPLWDSVRSAWIEQFVDLPITPEGKLLLVPKAVVRQSLAYRLEEYFRHHLLTHLQREEFNANSSLVRVLKDGTREFPYKTSLIEKYGSEKDDIAKATIEHPEVYLRYKAKKDAEDYVPLGHEQIAHTERTLPPDWDQLLGDVVSTKPGLSEASLYEKRVESLISALFYPDLTNPFPQEKIHDGRKRIDIRYTNTGSGSFFHWLSLHYSSAFIYIECKNYGRELANPELDQISGRFSPSRGQVGIIVCRQFADKQLFLQRCKYTAKDRRGYIMAVDDGDLRSLVEARKAESGFEDWPLLQQQFSALLS